MTARFLAAYETPANPEAFDRHYREVHIPLCRRLPGLRRFTVSRDVTAVRGAPYYLVAELEWDTVDELRAAFASPQGPRHRRRRGLPPGASAGPQHDLRRGRQHNRLSRRPRSRLTSYLVLHRPGVLGQGYRRRCRPVSDLYLWDAAARHVAAKVTLNKAPMVRAGKVRCLSPSLVAG
jgi:uncharacterized protein (TIGR02118 family)